MDKTRAVALLRASFDAAVAAADPMRVLAAHLPSRSQLPAGQVHVMGAGKASAAMARALELAWPDVPLCGAVVTRYGHAVPTQRIRVIEAAHPVPDGAGEHAAALFLQQARRLSQNDALLVLLSGGGSALLALPPDGVTLSDLQATTASLLRCGAPIERINTVRKHLSQIQGGWLAKHATAHGAQVYVRIISDVVGDRPEDIASGPCAPDSSTYAHALAVIHEYACTVPDSVMQHLSRGAAGEWPETPKPGDHCFSRVDSCVIATAHASLAAAAQVFESEGIRVQMLGDAVCGAARKVALVHAALVREIRAQRAPSDPPVALMSGGECTVTLPHGGGGRGGRCTEYLLSLAVALDAMPDTYALAADTDGIDGTEANAGAWLVPEAITCAAQSGLKPVDCLDAHDAWGFFNAAKSLVHTGPTHTNVNDYRVILVC